MAAAVNTDSQDTLSENEAADTTTTSGEIGEKLPSQHDPTELNITPSMLYDILSKQSQEVLMRPMLLMTGGLPNSGKSRAIKELLQLESDESSSQQGFTCYNMISIASSGITARIGNSQLFHDFGFLAGLKTSLHREIQTLSSFTEDGPLSVLDNDNIHREHRMGLKATWEKLMGDENFAGSRLFRSINLKKGPALVKIWDTGFDSFSLQFLRCFSGHFYNSYMWLFTDVERDLPKLHLPPSINDTQLMARRSRIQYLLNPSKLSSKLNGIRQNVCTIFALHKNKLTNEVYMLEEECKSAAPQIGCANLVEEKVIPISFESSTKNEMLKRKILKTMIASKISQYIPLSHLFLRGSLELESSVFMRREELKRKARLCGIDDDESFDEFCKSFTSFGSIIDVSLVSTSDIIIVKPDEFLTTLDKAFDLAKNKGAKIARNGILTNDVALPLLGKEYQLFLEVLEAVGLATLIAKDQCFLPQDCYYMPSLRQHNEDKYFNPERIQMVMSMRYPSVNMEVALTKRLLQDNPTFKLTANVKRNVTKITFDKGEVEIVYHGEVIELMVLPDEEIRDVIEKVINICKTISQEMPEKRYGKANFHFAILCQKHVHHIGYNFYRKRHILPIEGSLDCPHCPPYVTERFKLWSSVIKDARVNEQFKLDRKLTSNDIAKLSMEISKYECVHVLGFIKALGQDRQLPDDQSQWENVLTAAINEWMLQPHKESTKKKMAVILIELHMEFKNSNTETQLKFKQLARQLDIQILTMEQIKVLELKDYGEDEKQQLNAEDGPDAQLMQSKIQAHIQEEGELKISVVKGMLYGPPRVGKTSLMKRLIGEELPKISPSTGIDSPITVPIYEDAQFVPVAIVQGKDTHKNEWKSLNLNETLQICLNHFLPKSKEVTQIKSSIETPVRSKESNRVSKETSSPLASGSDDSDCVIIFDEHEGFGDIESDEESNDETKTLSHSPVEMPTEAENVPDKKNDDIKKPDDNVGIPTKIVDFIKNQDWKKVNEELKGLEEMTLFQIIDVGGQPEFHDILPLLLTGPAIYLLFFNLNQELDQRYTYLYQHEDGSTSGTYKSQLTVFQVLHQILSSISSMSEFSPAIVIGTHLDQIKSEHGKEFIWKHTDDPLKDRMKEHFYYKSLILNQVDGEYCIVFPVDNKNGTMEDEIKPLRQKIKAKLKELKGTPLPTSWALFYYLLKTFDNNGKWYCTLDEAKQLAEDLKIKDVEEALIYFHEQFGSVLYYHDVEDENHNKYVFCDPNVILRAVNELVAVCFGSNPESKCMQVVVRLRATGIVTTDEFKNLCESFSDKRLCSYVIKLLESRHILSSISVKGIDRYFIPCLLHSSYDTKYTPPSPPQDETVALLLLKFLHKDDRDESFSFVPPGLFSSTLVKLSNESGWELLGENHFKNKVTFSCSNRSASLSVTLIAQDEWIEVRVNEEPTSLTPSCIDIKKDIEKAITVSESDTLLGRFLQFVKLDVGFYCQENKHYASMQNDTQMLCKDCQCKYQPLMDKHKIWFKAESDSSHSISDTSQSQIEATDSATSTVIPHLDIMSKTPKRNHLVEVLNGISDKWELIGIALDVEHHRISSIKNEERDDRVRLSRILQEWLNSDEDATWTTIVEAVQGPTVNMKSQVKKINEFLLRSNIRKKYVNS